VLRRAERGSLLAIHSTCHSDWPQALQILGIEVTNSRAFW